MRRTAIPFVILVTIALLAWLFRDAEPPRLAPPSAESPAAAAEVSPPPPADVAAEPLVAREPLTVAESPASQPPASEALLVSDETTPKTTGEHDGRIVLRDVDGREIAAGSGTLEGWLKQDGSGFGSGPIAVRDGRFRVDLPEGRKFEPGALELDGEPAFAEEVPLDLDAAGELVIEARRVRPLRLIVVDATTEQPLEGIEVVAIGGGSIDDVDHPGHFDPDDRLIADGRSPLTLKPPRRHGDLSWTMRVTLHAAGYAWRAVPLDFARGGDERVALVRGADLEVAIAGEFERGKPGPVRWNESRPLLRVRRSSADSIPPLDREGELARVREAISELGEEELAEAFPDGQVPEDAALLDVLDAARELVLEHRGMARLVAQKLPAATGPTRIEGLAPGRYLVALEQGDHWSNPRVFAEQQVELTAGTTRTVELQLRPDDRPLGVPFAGRVRLSPSWGQSYPLDLSFEPIAVPGATSAEEFELDVPLRGSPDGPEWHRFDAGRRLAGRWLVTSYTYDFQAVVDTGPAGSDALEIVIGDPADAWIKLLDARTGRTIAFDDPETLHWWCERPAESNGGSLEDARWDAAADAWHVRAPAGRVGLSLQGDAQHRYVEPDDWVVPLVPGRNDFTFTLPATQSLELRFELDGRPLPRASGPFDFRITERSARAVNTANGKKLRSNGWGDSKLWFRFPKPGRWRIEVAELPGYAKVEPFEIDVAEGEFLIHRVALVRAQ